MREKDFKMYSQARKGLMPRALMLNNADWIIKDLLSQPRSRLLQIVEIGFNHGNDSRYLAKVVYEHLKQRGWSFSAYDYEKYFMPENLEIDEADFPGINTCIKAIPCTLENLSFNEFLLPEEIDLFYSSKTLTLCDKSVFYKLMSSICRKTSYNGFVVCSLHTHVDNSDTFPMYSELLDMVVGKNSHCTGVFSDFSLVIQPEDQECNFAFVAKKTGVHKISFQNDIFENESQNEYATKAKNEGDSIFYNHKML